MHERILAMSAPSLPDFERTLRLGQGNLDEAELAESHGLLCGLICRGKADTADDFISQLAAMRLLAEPGGALASVMVELWQCTTRQLDDAEMGFELWLPSDDEPLDERTISLAQWCSGFLAGLGSGGQLDSLSPEAREAIGDLQQIARAELTVPPGADAVSEEDEQAYAEIVEYVRVVAMTMREEFRGPEDDEPIH
jgi:uncharacterized protein YgfB (UPF0149 family)